MNYKIIFILSLLALSISSCGSSDPSSTQTPIHLINIEFDRGELIQYDTGNVPTSIDPDNYQYSLTELTTKTNLGIKVDADVGGYVKINGNVLKTNTWNSINLSEISDGSVITIEYSDLQYRNVHKKLIIQTLPKDFPRFTVFGKLSEAGELAIAPWSWAQKHKSYLLLLDENGNIKYYKRSPNKNYTDFKRYNTNGTIRYSYIEGTYFVDGTGGENGLAYVLDENLRVLDVVDGLLPNPSRNRAEKLRTENHEFLWIEDNHYLMSAYYSEDVNNIPNMTGSAKVAGSVLQEQKDSNILFEWNSTDFPSLYTSSLEGNNFNSTSLADYMHFNSITIDPGDNNFVMSFRNESSIAKIDRNTGNILWTYGGTADQFGLTPRQLPQGQHFARITTDGSMTYFDDNTYCEGLSAVVQWFLANNYCSFRDNNSRIVKVKLDEQNHLVTSFQEYRFLNSAPSYNVSHNLYQHSGYMGSVQELEDGNFLVGFGSRGSAERDVIEMDPLTGAVLFEFYFNYANKSPNQDLTYSYRAQFSK